MAGDVIKWLPVSALFNTMTYKQLPEPSFVTQWVLKVSIKGNESVLLGKVNKIDKKTGGWED